MDLVIYYPTLYLAHINWHPLICQRSDGNTGSSLTVHQHNLTITWAELVFYIKDRVSIHVNASLNYLCVYPGWVLPYLYMIGRFHADDPFLGGFSIRLGPYFIPQHNPIDPLFLLENIGLSLWHLIQEILGLEFGLIFHQNVLLNRF